MQKLGVCDTRCQLFFKEVSQREQALKTKWFLTNRQRLIDNLKNEKLIKKAHDIIDKAEEIKKQQEYEDRIFNEQLRKKHKTYPEWRPKIDDSISTDYMKPINSEIQNILYAKNVRSFDAKHDYLKERYRQPPEDRFYYPDCSSWIYGWRIKDFLN